VGLQGFRALDSLGVEALTGFITAYFRPAHRPLVASALTATLGAGSAQLARCGSPRRSTPSR
jgi:phospholipid/cholesterol/gamma-HCH transport system permease protein